MEDSEEEVNFLLLMAEEEASHLDQQILAPQKIIQKGGRKGNERKQKVCSAEWRRTAH